MAYASRYYRLATAIAAAFVSISVATSQAIEVFCSRGMSLVERFALLFDSMLRIAFPPDPLHIDRFADWRLALARIAAPFRAFLERARLHEQFSGDGYRLDTLSRVT